MKKMSSVNKITLLNILSMFILQGISFLTIPIFTRMLGTEQYGDFSIYNSWVSILTCMMGLNVGSSIGTGKYHFKDNYNEFRSCTLLLGSIFSLALICVCMALIVPLADVLGYGIWVYILMLFTAFGQFVLNFAQLAFIYEKKAWSNFILSILISSMTVGFSVILINFCSADERYLGRIIGFSIPYIATAIILWLLLFFKKPARLKKEYVKYAIILGLPIVFHALSQNVLAQSDRMMLQFLSISSSDIGIYSLYYSFSGVMVSILSALNNSWCPFYYDDLDKEDWDSLDKKIKNYIEIFTVLIVGFILLSREVSYLLADEEFWPGIELIPIITSSCYFTFLYQFPVNFEFYKKKTYIIAIGTISAASLNIGLNFVFINLWGIYGAAFTTAVSYLFLFLIHLFIVKINKHWQYKVRLINFLPSILLVGCSCALFYSCKDAVALRWTIATLIGLIEIFRLCERKTIF